MCYLGIDLGSSSVKLALIDSVTGKSIAVVSEPESEMDIKSLEPDWAEQNPEKWWKHTCIGLNRLMKKI